MKKNYVPTSVLKKSISGANRKDLTQPGVTQKHQHCHSVDLQHVGPKTLHGKSSSLNADLQLLNESKHAPTQPANSKFKHRRSVTKTSNEHKKIPSRKRIQRNLGYLKATKSTEIKRLARNENATNASNEKSNGEKAQKSTKMTNARVKSKEHNKIKMSLQRSSNISTPRTDETLLKVKNTYRHDFALDQSESLKKFIVSRSPSPE